MTVSSEISAIRTNISDSYTAVAAKGGTIPSNQSLDNLSTAIESIEPSLQDIIVRQNGTYEAESGYDGLGEVDVGVGQVGETYSAVNKTGNAISQFDKVWLTYKEVQPSQSVYNQSIYNYEQSIAFVSNAQETGILYKQSNNNGNLFNLLNFTVESLSGLALFNTQYTLPIRKRSLHDSICLH